MSKLDPALLRTFVEVARSGGLSRAANSMELSERDISRRIKALEAHLGYSLVNGRGDSVTLLPQGKVLFDLLDAGFEAVDKACAKGSAAAGRERLVVSALGPFVKGWLTPRLSGFTKSHPEIALRVDADSLVTDFDRERVDLAVRFGLGKYPGLETTRLFAQELIVVASPAMLARGPVPKEPADCVSYPLLRVQDRPYWHLWFKALGLSGRSIMGMANNGPVFASDEELRSAAGQGRGFALVNESNVGDDLDAGRLVRVLETPWPEDFAYYLVGRPEGFKKKAAAAFRTWIVKEARRERPRGFMGLFGSRDKAPAAVPA